MRIGSIILVGCVRVLIGFAGVKLSGSLSKYGSFRASTVSIMMVTVNPKMSFTVKYGWNGILSVFLFSPSGFAMRFSLP